MHELSSENSLESSEEIEADKPTALYSFLHRKDSWQDQRKKAYYNCKRDKHITLRHMEWPTHSSEEELDYKTLSKSKLIPSSKQKELQENWKKDKEIYQKLRPKKTPIILPPEDRQDNNKVFKQFPEYFKANGWFQDLEKKYNTNWFKIREDIKTLREKANIKDIAYAKTMMSSVDALIKRKLSERKKQKFETDEDSSPDEFQETEKGKEIVTEIGEIIKKEKSEERQKEIEKEQNELKSMNEGIADSNEDSPFELTDEAKKNILKNATLYRQEYSLKAIKGPFFKWKSCVKKMSTIALKNLKEEEELRVKQMKNKNLFERENMQIGKKDKMQKKELYYDEEFKKMVLSHKLPDKKLIKFIKNCNDLYSIDDKTKKKD